MKSEIIHGDCLAVLREMESHSADAVVTDPPFFTPAIHYSSRVNWGRKWADLSILKTWWETTCIELCRVLKKAGHCLVFCHHESYPVFYEAMYPMWDKLVCLVWDKKRAGLGRIWRHQHEFIIAARNKGHYLNEDGRLHGDVLEYKAELTRNRQHPTQKPIELLRDLIKRVVPPGGLIVDPFAGSGTTVIAAGLEGFSCIGIEKEEEYARIAQARVAHWLKLSPSEVAELFVPDNEDETMVRDDKQTTFAF